MKSGSSAKGKAATAPEFLAVTQRAVLKQYLPRIVKCLKQLSEEEIWWRPNPESNSVGNLVLHLCGNVRQWIISGLGGAEDVRERDLEFAEQGPVASEALVAQLRRTMREASRVLARLGENALLRKYEIQGYHVTGIYAVFQVAEHFSYHAGQIIYITKFKRGEDLKFTHLPPIKKNRNRKPFAKAHSV
jgi:uncharacterized damage-inducible protein DinB